MARGKAIPFQRLLITETFRGRIMPPIFLVFAVRKMWARLKRKIMIKKIHSVVCFFAWLVMSEPLLAFDSYRYFKVTIDGPWMIFLFLLPIVLSPLILMAILYWYFARVKAKEKLKSADHELQKIP